MLAVKRSAGVTPDVNVHPVCLHQVRRILLTLALKPRGDITRSPKQGYQWPHKRACVHQLLKIDVNCRVAHDKIVARA